MTRPNGDIQTLPAMVMAPERDAAFAAASNMDTSQIVASIGETDAAMAVILAETDGSIATLQSGVPSVDGDATRRWIELCSENAAYRDAYRARTGKAYGAGAFMADGSLIGGASAYSELQRLGAFDTEGASTRRFDMPVGTLFHTTDGYPPAVRRTDRVALAPLPALDVLAAFGTPILSEEAEVPYLEETLTDKAAAERAEGAASAEADIELVERKVHRKRYRSPILPTNLISRLTLGLGKEPWRRHRDEGFGFAAWPRVRRSLGRSASA